MARPIPVVAFAIAAYFAYGRRSTPALTTAQRLFWRLWRKLPGEGVEVLVRIRADARADLWLGSIVETKDGFTGTVAIAPQSERNAVGTTGVGFQLHDIRNWRIKADLRGPSLSPRRKRNCEAGVEV